MLSSKWFWDSQVLEVLEAPEVSLVVATFNALHSSVPLEPAWLYNAVTFSVLMARMCVLVVTAGRQRGHEKHVSQG